MRICCFTSFALSYLAKASVLASTLKREHPDWTLVAVVTDEPDDEVEGILRRRTQRRRRASGTFDEVIWSRHLDVPDFERWIRRHNLVEACTAVKGPALCELASRDFDAVVYLDPDVAVFDSLEPVVSALRAHQICLTPHQLEPESAHDAIAIQDNEECSLDHGSYNLGFLAIRTQGEGLRFAHWWRARLLHFCRDDIRHGLFTDQRWCDLVPAFFDNVEILRDPGLNVASWNLNRRRIRIHPRGEITVNESPLRFFHYTKLGPVGRKMTERYAGDNTEVYELWRWYEEQVAAFTPRPAPDSRWSYGSTG